MRTTEQLSISLPREMAEQIKAKVAAGEYATQSEMIRDGLHTLLERDLAADGWLLEQVAPAYDALKAEPARGLSAIEVRPWRPSTAERVIKAHEAWRRLLSRGVDATAQAVSLHCGSGYAHGGGTVYRFDRQLLRKPADLP